MRPTNALKNSNKRARSQARPLSQQRGGFFPPGPFNPPPKSAAAAPPVPCLLTTFAAQKARQFSPFCVLGPVHARAGIACAVRLGSMAAASVLWDRTARLWPLREAWCIYFVVRTVSQRFISREGTDNALLGCVVF
ncbi:unnamed protein product, partial [Iphiclides podalirius]